MDSLQRLNEYEREHPAGDVWGDIIYLLPLDRRATELLDPHVTREGDHNPKS